MGDTVFIGSKGTKYVIQKKLAVGGEGEIYYLRDRQCAKIYLPKVLQSNPEIASKIKYMVSHPPTGDAIRYMAWPTDYLVSDGKFIGFVMGNLSDHLEMRKLYDYSKQKNPNITMNLQVALNLSLIVKHIHDSDYVIGDFNPKNIGYSQDGTVCVYDNDSFQFVDKDTNKTYRCNVQFPGYVAPEIMEETTRIKQKAIMQGCDANTITLRDLEIGFTQNTDNFALAVHIFQLMMNGFNPFSSIPKTDERCNEENHVDDCSSSSIVPSSDTNVLLDNYCYNDDRKPYNQAVPERFEFPEYIISLFDKAFNHNKFKERPTANDWIQALNLYCTDSVRCKRITTHIYWNKLDHCPYCSANARYAKATANLKMDPKKPRLCEPMKRPQPKFDSHWI